MPTLERSPLPTWEDGPRHAPTLLFLHGATADHRSWNPQVTALRDRFRVVTVDLPGHGDTAEAGPFDVDDAVAGVVDLLDRLDRPVALVGLSLGGVIAQEVVYRHPERVDALVVADSTPLTARRGPLDKPAAIASLLPMALVPHELFHRRAAKAFANEPDVRDDLAASAREWSPAAVVQMLVALVTALHPEPDYRLPLPTLLIHGADDRLGDIAHAAREWAGRDPAVEHIVVPDAGHVSNMDNPDAFTAELVTFLDRALPTSPGSRPVAAGPPAATPGRIGRVVARLRSAARRAIPGDGARPGGPSALDRQSAPGPRRTRRSGTVGAASSGTSVGTRPI